MDSERNDLDVPPPVTDWENYGGITRSVSLVTVPETFIDDAWVRLGKDGRIVASVRLNGASDGEITGKAAHPVARPDHCGRDGR